MNIVYICAGYLIGHLFPEFLRMISPRDYRIPISMNIMAGFIAGAVTHYFLTH
jgi:hypothetical protein